MRIKVPMSTYFCRMNKGKNVHENILGAIGNTPLIKLNKIVKDFPCEVYAKVEYFNPGHSVKDRMALQMIEDAEASGDLNPEGPSSSVLQGTRVWVSRLVQ